MRWDAARQAWSPSSVQPQGKLFCGICGNEFHNAEKRDMQEA